MGEHYYGEGGEERYDAGMREVRKDHLLPSVTTILNVINKYGLNIWKQNLIYSSMWDYMTSNVMADTCGDPYWEEKGFCIAEVKANLKTEMNKSAEEGAQIHRGIEAYFKGQRETGYLHPKTEAAFDDFVIGHKISANKIEHSFANYDLGFGGKIDFIGKIEDRPVIIDWKTKDTEGKNGIQLYNEVPMQLAACAEGICAWGDMGLVTVIISRDEPGEIHRPKYWNSREKYYQAFRSAQQLWCAEKNYNPWTGGKWF